MTRAAALAASLAALLLASCGGGPGGVNPQAGNPSLAPTLASLGRAPELRDLDGLAPAQVAAMIGEPDLRRVDPPAEIWQYRSADCVLDLFFYQEKDGQHLVYAEGRSRNPQRGVRDTRCADASAPLKAHTKQTRL